MVWDKECLENHCNMLDQIAIGYRVCGFNPFIYTKVVKQLDLLSISSGVNNKKLVENITILS